jgi:hypothetical protein
MKQAFRANELVEHPGWCLEYEGACYECPEGPCLVELANDEARAYEVEAMRFIAERYRPDVIQLEEPYYHDGGQVPTNPAFADKYFQHFGTSPPSTHDWHVAAVKRDIIDAFANELQQALFTVDSAIGLHVNVATSFGTDATTFDNAGLNPDAWRNNGWLDGWLPQLYGDGASWFGGRLHTWQIWQPSGATRPFEDYATLIPGVEIYFDFQTNNDSAEAQTFVAEEGGSGATAASGSALFSFMDPQFQHVEADLANHLPAALQGTLGSSDAVEATSDPTWVEGPAGGSALHFDGAADFVKVPGAYAFDEWGGFSFATRVRIEPGARASFETFVSRGSWSMVAGYVWIYSRGDDCIWFEYADGEANTARLLQSDPIPALYDGAWHHLAVVQDRAARTVVFYVDGQAYGTRDYQGWSRAAVHGDFFLGTYGGSADLKYSLHGDLSDVRWYRHVLDAAQIGTLAGEPATD